MTGKNHGILIVNFGSSYELVRKKCFDKIEETIKKAYPDYMVYTAYTSQQMRKKTMSSEQAAFGVTEALKQMQEEGISTVYIQPTFICKGRQNSQMRKQAMGLSGQFERLLVGEPLLSSLADHQEAVDALAKACCNIPKDEAVIWMGHGEAGKLCTSFTILDHLFKVDGHDNYYVAALRTYPDISQIIDQLKGKAYHKIHIMPLMLTAGYHAHHDLTGQGKGTWQQHLEEQGYEVSNQLKGLGEYEEIRRIYVRHIQNMIDEERK